MPRQALNAARIQVVVGVIESASGELLVNRRRQGSHMAGFWEFPGGKRKRSEARFAALCRELEEELAISVIAARPFVALTHDYADRSVELDVWLVERYGGTPAPNEAQELKWVALEDVGGLELLPADAPIVAALRARRQLSMSSNGTFLLD